jgi:uncharacterized lipoprotein YbaY/heat shock protein HslJ
MNEENAQDQSGNAGDTQENKAGQPQAQQDGLPPTQASAVKSTQVEPAENGKNGGPSLVLIVAGIAFVALVIVLILYAAGVIKSGPDTGVPTSVAPFITIENPVEGAVLANQQPVTISGMAGGLFEGGLVVEVLDASGNVLVQAPVTVQAPEAGLGEPGPWSVEVLFSAETETGGTVRAYARSAEDNSLVVDAHVPVSFAPLPTQPFIIIDIPGNGDVLDVATPVTVSGSAGSLFEGNLVVEALDQAGNLLAQQSTIIQSEEAGTGGQGPWSVQLTIQVSASTPGTIRAFATSAKDGSLVAEDSRQVTFETISVASYIVIQQPTEGAVLDTNQPFLVSGMAGGLFEGNVVVEALDNQGNLLASEATTIQSENAGIGGEGPWSISLSVNVPPGTPGTVRAYSQSPADGNITAEASVPAVFGQEDGQVVVQMEDHAWLLTSLLDQPVVQGTLLWAQFKNGNLTGFAGCNAFNGTYTLEAGAISIGPLASTLKICESPAGVMEQETQYLTLLGTASLSVIDGSQLKIADGAGNVGLVYDAAVIGNVVAVEGSLIPEGAVVSIRLDDVSRADAPANTIAEQQLNNITAFPFSFSITYDPALIDPRMTYALNIRITDSGGKLIYINTQVYQVITRDNPSVLNVKVDSVE